MVNGQIAIMQILYYGVDFQFVYILYKVYFLKILYQINIYEFN